MTIFFSYILSFTKGIAINARSLLFENLTLVQPGFLCLNSRRPLALPVISWALGKLSTSQMTLVPRSLEHRSNIK